MTVYDDPSQLADILRSAVQGAEEQGASTVMIAPVILEHAARFLDRMPEPTHDEGPEDCADSESKTGLGIDSHRYIFQPWRKGLVQCSLCVSVVLSGNVEGHAHFHVLNGEFPIPTAVGYPDVTEVWAHKTATGWVMKTIRGRLG